LHHDYDYNNMTLGLKHLWS